jgi:4-hydroxy-tetrahydrodipicolinate reductase
MSVRIGIAGVSGRMGRLLVEEVAVAGCALSGGARRGDTLDALGGGAGRGEPRSALPAPRDVVVDFTRASAVQGHAAALAAAGTAWVLGTSGLSAADEAAVDAAATRIPIVYAANFSAGVTLVLALAERMAATLPAAQYDAEILEMHHRQKVDAPSGTALALGRAVAAGRGVDLAAVMQSGRDGHTGPRETGAIGFAALRGGQVVGEHSLLFAGADEQIILTHKAFDRRTFASGAVRAALWVAGRPPGLYGMKDVLGLA